MRVCGHTMGVPGRDAFQAIKLFSDMGFDGIELRCASDGQIDPENYTEEEGTKIREAADAFGLEIACLTPYYKDYLSPERRRNEIDGMKKVIDIAGLLRCTRMRAYGGTEPPQVVDETKAWNLTVPALKEICEYADDVGVYVCIENHPGTLARTAAETVKLVEEVRSDNVKILYDQANISRINGEDFATAIDAQRDHIYHVHVKDQKFINGKRVPTLLGKGTVEWRSILEELNRIGYQGFLSDEYEKHWHPDLLPEPEVGMKHNLQYVREILKRL